jgi:hypothetical protein
MSQGKALDAELQIVELFMQNVKGKQPDTTGAHARHDGSVGHWLERQMGVVANRKTEPDLLGFEMKNATKSKTTFGDWSASYYIFKDPRYGFSRSDFLRAFGKPNLLKKGRPSWSGEPIPKINQTNRFGSTLLIDEQDNVLIVYDFAKDQRPEKHQLIRANMQISDLVLAQWNQENLRTKVEDKFNQNGWFKCERDAVGIYQQIVFGDPLSFDNWLKLVRDGIVFFDSGMYEGNSRNYSQWRANNALWESLIVRRYD